jgi:predicted RND superfamily exporter protein
MKKILKNPWLALAAILIITAFFALQFPRLELDNNNFRFISEDDPARQTLSYIDDTFGSSVFILVGFKRHYGTVFDAAFLNRVREYVDRIEQIEIVEPVSSIVNADYVTGSGDTISVEKLLSDDFAGADEEIAALKEKLLSWDMYRRSLISDDFTATQILVPLSIASEDSGRPEVIDSFIQVRDIALEMFGTDEEVYVTGIPIISATINEAMRSDLVLLIPLVILVVLLTLFFSFRRAGAVILPLLTVLIAAIWSVGAMPLFDIKLSVVSTVLPVILVAVGSAYGIHVITHYLEETKGGAAITREQHFDLVCGLVAKIQKPVFLAALTTFVGFISFCFTTVLPIREFGFFASFGVLSSFAIAMTMIPALLILRGPAKASGETDSARKNDSADAPVARFFTLLATHRGAVLFFTAVFVLIAIYGASRLVIDNVFIEYFKADTDIARSDKFIRDEFGGSKIVSVVAETPSSEELLLPQNLLAMDGLSSYLESEVPEAGKSIGFTDLVKRINQVFNVDESPDGIRRSTRINADSEDDGDFGFGADDMEFGFGFGTADDADNIADYADEEEGMAPAADSPADKTYTLGEMTALLDRAARSGPGRDMGAEELLWQLKRQINYQGAAYYEIPADPARYGKSSPEELSALISNYLILLSGDIDSYANDPLEPTAIKTTVQLKTLGEADTARGLAAINNYIASRFPPGLKVTVGGTALVESSLNTNVVRSQIISLFISLALVFIIIAVSNKSLAAGLVGVIPLCIAILINFAVMGFLGIKLNIGTSMIASLAVGIGIDYTIHYMEAFKREAAKAGRDRTEFLARTFAVSGKAIIINAVSVGAGFAVLIFSRFNMLGDFGLLIALTMGVSGLVSLTVIPALLLAFKPRFAYRNMEEKS